MQLTKNNLERCGWMFSETQGLMIAEHELGNGKWDIEINGYKRVGECWEPDTNIFSAYDTFEEMIKDQPELKKYSWIDGDLVEMW